MNKIHSAAVAFQNRNPESKYVRRRWSVLVGLGAAALGSLGLYNHITAPQTEKVKVTFTNGEQTGNWGAAEEIATLEGQSPNNSGIVEAIDQQLQDNEGQPYNGLVKNGETVYFDVNLPLAKQFTGKTEVSGHGVTINLPEQKPKAQ